MRRRLAFAGGLVVAVLIGGLQRSGSPPPVVSGWCSSLDTGKRTRPGDFTLDLVTTDTRRLELLQRLARPFGSYRLYRLTVEEYDAIEKWFRPRYLRTGDIPATGR